MREQSHNQYFPLFFSCFFLILCLCCKSWSFQVVNGLPVMRCLWISSFFRNSLWIPTRQEMKLKRKFNLHPEISILLLKGISFGLLKWSYLIHSRVLKIFRGKKQHFLRKDTEKWRGISEWWGINGKCFKLMTSCKLLLLRSKIMCDVRILQKD